MSDPQELISIYRAGNITEAHLVKNLLAEQGVEAYVTAENDAFSGLPMAAPDVFVKRLDEVQASAIVSEFDQHQIARAESERGGSVADELEDSDFEAEGA